MNKPVAINPLDHKRTLGNHPLGNLASERFVATGTGARKPAAGTIQAPDGFTLVELLLALGLGLLVAAWLLEALLAQGNLSAKLVDRLHHREFERRARRLIEDDRRLASLAASQPGAEGTACNLAGRQPLLQLQLPAGKPPITWSLGSAPSSIWRGQVLMRCGPAYGLDGQPSLTGSWQNRVVLDRAEGFEIPI